MKLASKFGPAWLLAALFTSTVVPFASCGGGGGGSGTPFIRVESEPNDTAATADLVNLDQTGIGELNTAAEIDYWRVALTGGTVLTVELFATRLDQEDWDPQDCVPRLTLYDVDGTTKLLEQDFSGVFSGGWGWGKHDLDIPQFLVPATGTYYLSISVDGAAMSNGDYGVRPSASTPGSLQQEVEALPPGGGSNDTAATAEAATESTIHGYHADGESDYYSFAISIPSLVKLEIGAYRNGVADGDDDYYDPQLDLFDTDGTTLLASNDDAFFSDSGIQYVIAAAGTYYVRVHESAASAGDAPYFLTISDGGIGAATETEPNDTTATASVFSFGNDEISGTIGVGEIDFFTFPALAGEMVRLQVFDGSNFQGAADAVSVRILGPDGVTPVDTGGGGSFKVLTTIPQADGDYFVEVTPSGGSTDYHLSLSLFFQAPYEAEPNDSIPTATSAGLGTAGVIDPPGEIDYFEFTALANRITTFKVYASRGPTTSDGCSEFSGHGSTLIPAVRILDGDGDLVELVTCAFANVSGESVTDPLPTTSVSFVEPSSGSFFVEITDALGGGGPTAYYVVVMEQ